MRTVELLGFLAFALNVAGNLLLTSKNSRGWIIRIWSNAAQIGYAVLIVSPSLVTNGSTFFAINLYGWWRWRRLLGHADFCGVGRVGGTCNCGRGS